MRLYSSAFSSILYFYLRANSRNSARLIGDLQLDIIWLCIEVIISSHDWADSPWWVSAVRSAQHIPAHKAVFNWFRITHIYEGTSHSCSGFVVLRHEHNILSSAASLARYIIKLHYFLLRFWCKKTRKRCLFPFKTPNKVLSSSYFCN